MGDIRYRHHYERIRNAPNPLTEIRTLTDEGVISALAATARADDPYIANVLATEAMNRVEQKATVMAHLAEGVYAVNSRGRLTFMNPAAERLLGWSLAEIAGEEMDALVTGVAENGDDRRGMSPCAPVLATGRIHREEDTVFHARDGRRVPVAFAAAPIVREGEVWGAVVVFHDITERKRAEETTQRLAAVVESSNDAILTKTLDGVVTSWNPAAERLFGFTAEEMVGARVTRIIPPGRRKEEDEFIARVRAGDMFTHYETQRVARDGRVLDVSLTLSPLRDAEGNVIGVSSITRDITARKQRAAERTAALLDATTPAGPAAPAWREAWRRGREGAGGVRGALTRDVNARYRNALGYAFLDRVSVWVLWAHLAVLVVLALAAGALAVPARFPSPLGWRVVTLEEAVIVITLGAVAALGPTLTRGRLSSHYAWRASLAASLTVLTFLFIFVSGGAVEMHFLFFIHMGYMAIYADWRLGWIIVPLALVHHAILDFVQPEWLFGGESGEMSLTLIAHGIPLVLMALFTTLIARTYRGNVASVERARQLALEDLQTLRAGDSASSR